MKCDIVRAWKDEIYRQGLSKKQLNTLPANPAGELTDALLEVIVGYGGPDVGVAPVAAAPVGVGLVFARNESFGVHCEINVFSLNPNPCWGLSNVAILGSATQVCGKG